MKVAAIQTRPSPDTAANIDTAMRLIDEAAEAGASFVVLPEYLDWHGDLAGHPLAARQVPNTITDRFCEKARQHKIWVLSGSIHELVEVDGKFRNSIYLINPDGEIAGQYSKMHMFDVEMPGMVIQESATCEPGNEAVVLPVNGVPVGLSICYDLRFPELYRALSSEGAKIICVSAAFLRKTGMLVWEVLLRARAIENQAYVIASNQVSGTPDCYGHSMIIDPLGNVLVSIDDEIGYCIADLDSDFLERIRSEVPALAHRRSEL